MREIVCVKNNRNVDSNELRQRVEKLKPMHSIALQKTFLSNAIKPTLWKR